MRQIRLIILLISITLFSGCYTELEIQPKEYPFVITNSPVISKDGAGAELFADILNLGNQDIVEYGFVWSRYPHPTRLDNIKLLETEPKKGIYSCNVKYIFTFGLNYYIRAYIRTNKSEIYGNEILFYNF